MNTVDLRSLIKTTATGIPHARIWPNGLGFDCRGVEYTYTERTRRWAALHRRCANYPEGKYGEGPTPEAAKRAAGIGRPEHRARGGSV